jgi:hypothetical protein
MFIWMRLALGKHIRVVIDAEDDLLNAWEVQQPLGRRLGLHPGDLCVHNVELRITEVIGPCDDAFHLHENRALLLLLLGWQGHGQLWRAEWVAALPMLRPLRSPLMISRVASTPHLSIAL